MTPIPIRAERCHVLRGGKLGFIKDTEKWSLFGSFPRVTGAELANMIEKFLGSRIDVVIRS